MISKEDSIPKRSQNSLQAQDILWQQFNDINFYVEDVEQENFYFYILKRLFPSINIKKIFPLGGKDLVLKKSRNRLLDKKSIFILDLDFDDILDKRVTQKNLFYLKRYSIENYLVEKAGIVEFVKEERPKLKDKEIEKKLNYKENLKNLSTSLAALSSNFLLIKKYELGIEYLGIAYPRDFDLTLTPACIKNTVMRQYASTVERQLIARNKRLKYSRQIKNCKKHFNTAEKCLKNVPGKYIINCLMNNIRKIFSISQLRIESFTYRLAKNCDLSELDFLKKEISEYINTQQSISQS